MAKNDTSKRGLTAAQKQKRAVEMRIAGHSLDDIAAELGYSSHAGAHKAVMTALKKTMQEPADELRKMEAERLDRMAQAIWKKATDADSDKATWFIDRVLSIMERRARLLGLDKAEARDDIGTLADTFLAGANTMEAMQVKDLSEKG